jgi:hypothetical protein
MKRAARGSFTRIRTRPRIVEEGHPLICPCSMKSSAGRRSLRADYKCSPQAKYFMAVEEDMAMEMISKNILA